MVAIGFLMGLDADGLRAADQVAASVDDRVVLPLVNQTLEREPTGVEVQWSNPATGNRGTIIVLQTLSSAPDRPCRKYRRTRKRPETAVETIEGVGCRVGAGLWELEETAGAATTVEKTEAKGSESRPESSPAPAQRCPVPDPDMVVHVPCSQPAPFVDFTMPAKASY